LYRVKNLGVDNLKRRQKQHGGERRRSPQKKKGPHSQSLLDGPRGAAGGKKEVYSCGPAKEGGGVVKEMQSQPSSVGRERTGRGGVTPKRALKGGRKKNENSIIHLEKIKRPQRGGDESQGIGKGGRGFYRLCLKSGGKKFRSCVLTGSIIPPRRGPLNCLEKRGAYLPAE